MLMLLDDSLESALNTPSIDALAGLSSLFTAIYRREHLILGDRKLFYNFAAADVLSEFDRRIATAHSSALTELNQLKRHFTHYVKIVKDKGPDIQRFGNCWQIQLTYIGKNGIRPIDLLGEDITDASLFIKAAEHSAIAKNVFRIITPIADRRGAGGKGNVWRTFALTITKTPHWSYCVTDSDRLTTACGPTSLTRRIDKLVTDHSGSAVCDHLVLPTRELENLIPHSFVDDALNTPTTSVAQSNWKELTSTRATPISIMHHVDLKYGTTLYSIQKFTATSPQKAIWDAEIIRVNTITKVKSKCGNGICPKSANKHAACSCSVTPPILDKLAEKILEFLEHRDPKDTFSQLKSDPNQANWLSLGEKVLNWTAAPRKRYT